MRCQWKPLLDILPLRLRREVDRLGKQELQELRLRINAPPELVLGSRRLYLEDTVKREDLDFVVNTASRYSPWQASTAAQGYITAPGGHRIGLCGEVVYRDGQVTGIRSFHALCIRVARDYSGLVGDVSRLTGSILILGAPGWGKTTLLRDLIRQLSVQETVGVVDERGELFPDGVDPGQAIDVLTGCPKPQGLEMLLRTMGPTAIALDEITAPEDCRALIRAANCGVRLIATAHASSREEFCRSRLYRPLIEENCIHTLLILRRDKSWFPERITLCDTNGLVRL